MTLFRPEVVDQMLSPCIYPPLPSNSQNPSQPKIDQDLHSNASCLCNESQVLFELCSQLDEVLLA